MSAATLQEHPRHRLGQRIVIVSDDPAAAAWKLAADLGSKRITVAWLKTALSELDPEAAAR